MFVNGNGSKKQNGSLGNTCKITQPATVCGDPSKEIQNIDRRLEKWRLQSIVRSILPDERVYQCNRKIVPLRASVDVWKSKKSQKAFYGGLITCGSVWLCPVCASKISERRREELNEAMEKWKSMGKENSLYLLTFTVPHYINQSLKSILTKFNTARRTFKNRKTWKRLCSRIGLNGSIRALETTYGQNGWHVHSHEILLCDRYLTKYDLKLLEQEMLQFWDSACVSSGFGSVNGHGVSLQDGTYASQYIGKWGLDHELTKAHIKHGFGDSVTPWDMLRSLDSGLDMVNGDNRDYVDLFLEYARNFKGKRQLVWSDGLRDLLELQKDKSDEELSEELEEGAELLGRLSSDDWRLVLKADIRGELLEIAVEHGWSGVVRRINELVIRYGS